MKALAFLLSLATAFAAFDGTVVNRTTGKPQPGAMVILFSIGTSGPQPLATAQTDAQGKFTFAQSAEGGPHLIEATYAGVTYNLMVPPGSPSSNLQVEVYDSSKKPGAARVTQHIVLLEPVGQQLNVGETFFLENGGNVTWHDPERGTLRFFVPAAAKDNLKVSARAPGSMTLERVAEPAGPRNVYKLNFPIKPGETRIDVTYSMPFTSPGSFSGEVFGAKVPTRLVTPPGVTLAGTGLKPLGTEPNTQAAIYEVAGATYKVSVEGAGTLQASDSSGDDSGPSIGEILPRVYGKLAWVLAPSLIILALGFVLLYRRGERRG
jgi:hypothetical protein